jgi:hypothetical protein
MYGNAVVAWGFSRRFSRGSDAHPGQSRTKGEKTGMKRTLRRLGIAAGAVAYVALCSLGASRCDVGTGIISTATCLQCHSGIATDQSEFLQSAHRNVECEECHGAGYAHVRNGGRGGLYIYNPENESFEEHFDVCADCHETQPAQYAESTHFETRSASCYDCHDVHEPTGLTFPAVDNTLCLECHAPFGFDTPEAIEAHTHHPVSPATTGASRCTACHMPALDRTYPENGPNEHTLNTVPPIVSALATEGGQLAPPNTCMGAAGCHDGSEPGEPEFDLDNAGHMRVLQIIYETWYPGAPSNDSVE